MTKLSLAELITDETWLNEPRLFRGFSDRATWLLDRLHHACEDFGQGKTLPKLRVFVDNGNRTDLSVALARSPIAGQGLHEWISAAIGCSKYCLAFNGVTSWDEPLAAYVRDAFVTPLLSKMGRPIRGFDAYIFAGRYDLTPFGIHKDSEPSLLFHLGPALKSAFVWDQSIFREAVQDRELNEFDLENWEDRADHFELAPGDLLYLPAGQPHVMKSPEFSVTLGIVPNNCDTKGLLVEVSHEIADLRSTKQTGRVHYSQNGAVEALRALACETGSFLEESIEALNNLTLRLESNGYLVPPPAELKHLPAPQDDRTRYRLVPGYPLFASETGGCLIIRARGQVCSLRGTPGMAEWASQLNKGHAFSRKDAATALARDCDASAADAIIDMLLRIRALEAVTVLAVVDGA